MNNESLLNPQLLKTDLFFDWTRYLHYLRSRHTSGRSVLNPLGNDHFEFVAKGNSLLAKSVLLFLVSAAVTAMSVLEQPCGSIVQSMPRFQWLLSVMPVIYLSLFEQICGVI